jgi:hypothetical protein
MAILPNDEILLTYWHFLRYFYNQVMMIVRIWRMSHQNTVNLKAELVLEIYLPVITAIVYQEYIFAMVGFIYLFLFFQPVYKSKDVI